MSMVRGWESKKMRNKRQLRKGSMKRQWRGRRKSRRRSISCLKCSRTSRPWSWWLVQRGGKSRNRRRTPRTLRAIMITTYGMTSIWPTETNTWSEHHRCTSVTLILILATQRLINSRRRAQLISVYTLHAGLAQRELIVDSTTGFLKKRILKKL